MERHIEDSFLTRGGRYRVMQRPVLPVALNRRVLIVDDYADSADAMALYFELLGFETHATYGGLTALEVAGRWQPSYVILDIMMPDMSGFAVAAQLREDSRTSDSVLVAYTAANSPTDYGRAEEAGFDALCEKPADPTDLAGLLERLGNSAR